MKIDNMTYQLKLLLFTTICVINLVSTNTIASPDTQSETLRKEVHVSIGERPKQKFMGFGASQPTDQNRLFTHYGADRVKKISDRVYGDLGMNWVRLWVHSGAKYGVAWMKYQFYKSYFNNGYIDILKSSGVTHFLLAPARGEDKPDESMEEYAIKLAQFIYDVYKERGIRIDVTGIANEPAGFSPEQIRDTVKFLRVNLDSLGMNHVEIIAPECASPDACVVNAIKTIQASPEVWSALRGVATHSYNMGANYKVEELISDTHKEYWMTEAGRGLPRIIDEEPGETAEASGVAARFLNDMNHSVTHWFWFIGMGHFDKHPNKDSGQVLARPSDKNGGIKFNTKYHYLKQLRTVFDLGAQFYSAVGDEEGRMNWGYGQKPAITVSMAKNVDETWAIASVNTTGIDDSRIANFFPSAIYNVSIKVPEEAANLMYKSFRSRPDGYIQSDTLMTDEYGNINFVLQPHELITLRSIK